MLDFPREPVDVAEALEALRTVRQQLAARDDRRAAFAHVYALVTEKVAEQVSRPDGIFQAPEVISRLDGRFCARYLETLDWSQRGVPQDCRAWALAYRFARARSTIPFQDVILGICAHINYDLAFCIADTLQELGVARDARTLARVHRDHLAVNDLLRETIGASFAALVGDYRCVASRHLAGPPRYVLWPGILGVLRHWRERVWRNVERLIEPGADRARILRGMDRYSGAISAAVVAGNAAYATVRGMGRAA